MAERIHITTAIFYCNGTPHVGSAYEALAADVFARYQRRKLGRENVSFLSGTDEHGDKIRRAALAQGLEPQAYTDKMSALFDEAFRGLGVSYDYWVRTTDEVHQKWVQEMLRRTHARGDIYFRDYEGLYCVDCERFYTEKELLPGNVCPTHNRPVELISEGNYFLRIEKYREQVLEHIQRNPDFIRPERYRKEALNMLSEPLTDLCISRPKARLDWGIELPFDSNYVTYVWYDAFWAYVSHPATNDPGFVEKVWPNTEHFIGKDILKTHAVYWPPILLAAGLPLFKHLNVHGWLNFGGARMSKSSGNVRDPVSYEQAFGADVLRYFLMREVVYGLDGDFSEERLVERYNAELANDLGNLSSRVLTMAARYFQGEITATPGAGGEEIDRASVRDVSRGARARGRDGRRARVQSRTRRRLAGAGCGQQVYRRDRAVYACQGPGQAAARRTDTRQPARGAARDRSHAGAFHAAAGGETSRPARRRRDGGGCAVRRGTQARRSRQAAGRALSAYDDRQDRPRVDFPARSLEIPIGIEHRSR